MIAPTAFYHPDSEPCLWILCDLREPQAVRFVHAARAVFQERSDLLGFGPDHMILKVYSGVPLEHIA